MINEVELKNLLQDLESDRVERTISTKDTDKFSQAICAFANDLPNHKVPGYLIIGANNDGTVTGLKITDELLTDLGGIRSAGNILPLPTMNVAKYTLPEGEVAVVEVFPSLLPPVRYKGRIYIRTGPGKGIAFDQEERMLSEKRADLILTFDASPCLGTSLDDLSLQVFAAYRQTVVPEDVIAANNRTYEEQLASLSMYSLRHKCPTIAGLMSFGKNPRRYLPGYYIQYLRFPGDSAIDRPVDQEEISGDLLSVLRELDLRIKTNIQSTLMFETVLKEKNIHTYPEIAVRELVMNAIMHRDYQSTTPIRFYWFANRIEIQSPGGLYGDVTPDTLMTRNSYRNPVIAGIMKSLGYVNRFGYGIQRAQAALINNGNREALFEIHASIVKATIYKRET